jgi:hypothetical protein
MQVDNRLFPISDSPVEHDLLGYEPYAKVMAELLSNPGLETPFTVGIFGPWGTGKTTFMYLMSRHLEDTFTIFFRPWQFEQKEEVWKALIYSVLQRLEDHSRKNSSEAERQNERMMKLLKGVGRLALNATISTLTNDRTDFDTLVSFYSENERDNARFINTFRKEFEDLKDEILGTTDTKSARLTIFVDDLDRCTPENCIMVLEAIKLFFDFTGCVFVLGIDGDIVQKGIEIKYDERLKVRGVDYLEKMIQLPFTLPPVPPETFSNYVKIISEPLGINNDSLEMIAQASDENPRRVKRLCNCLYMVSHVAQEMVMKGEATFSEKGIDESKLALLLILQVRFPVAYRWLASRPTTFTQMLDDEDSYRSKLASFMTDYYEEALGLKVMNSFFMFLNSLFPKSDGLKDDTSPRVGDFTDPEEMDDYLRITGTVEMSTKPPVKQTREIIDDHIGSGDEESTTPKPRPRPPIGTGEATFQDLQDEAEHLENRWNGLRGLGTNRLMFMSPNNLADDLQDICESASSISRIVENSPFSNYQRTMLLDRLGKIDFERGYNFLRAIGTNIVIGTVLFPIVVAFIFSAVETMDIYVKSDITFLSMGVISVSCLAGFIRGWQFRSTARRFRSRRSPDRESP